MVRTGVDGGSVSQQEAAVGGLMLRDCERKVCAQVSSAEESERNLLLCVELKMEKVQT